MFGIKTRPRSSSASITNLPIEDIDPNPGQPRRLFAEDTMADLARSIAQVGILNPLIVRKCRGRYQLVAGERRLRAAMRAELDCVPCIIVDIDLEESGILALVENLQRENLDFLEEAESLRNMIRLFNLTREELAQKLGKSQSAISNKLRLLKLPEDVLREIRAQGLTERHARALLRLNNEQSQRKALEHIIAKSYNVAQTDKYIDELIGGKSSTEGKTLPKRSFILKDVRLFLNSLDRSLEIMNRGGIDASVVKEDKGDSLIVTICIPKDEDS